MNPCSNLSAWHKKLLIPNDFWHSQRETGKHIEPGALSGYYLDLRTKTRTYNGKKSSSGIPLVWDGNNRVWVQHPVTVCQVALGWWDTWLDDGKEEDLDLFLKLAGWLVRNQQNDPQKGGIWPIPYGIPFYDLHSGWISALVQGQALSVLTRAYICTTKRCYIEAAVQAFTPFNLTLEEGGVQSNNKHGLFFEEYPSSSPSRVLNGFISSLWGLYDYWLASHDQQAYTLWRAGVQTLVSSLSDYDTGHWSRYSLYQKKGVSNLASPYYHQEHIAQLQAMTLLTEHEKFNQVATRWERYFYNPVVLVLVLVTKFFSRLLMNHFNTYA